MCVAQENPAVPPQHPRAPSLRRLFEHWSARRGSLGLPTSSTITLLDLPHSLANIIVIDVVGAYNAQAAGRPLSDHDFVFNHIGSSIVMRYRRDLTGGTLQDLSHDSPARGLFIAAIHRAAQDRDAVTATLPAQGIPMPEIDIVVLPLADADGVVVQILVGSQIVGRPVVMASAV